MAYNKFPKRMESKKIYAKKHYYELEGKEQKRLLQPTRQIYEHSDKRIRSKNEYQKQDKYKSHRKEYLKKWNLLPTTSLVNRRKNMKRRAARNNIIEMFTPEQFLIKAKQCNGICPNCNKPFNKKDKSNWLTVDHIYPIKKANENFKVTGIKRIYTINDVEPLCFGCNSGKGDKIIVKPKGINF
jgi:5-methylcytosine-specific restriction endonuclease McrA